VIVSSEDSSYALVITNASIKNNVATSIAHIHIHNKPIIKTLHHAVNVTSTKAKLFSMIMVLIRPQIFKEFQKL